MVNTAAIVVTYNRDLQLIDCLNAIKNQTVVPSTLFIIDNNSTEATYNQLLKNGFITEIPQKESNVNQIFKSQVHSTAYSTKTIEVVYVRKFENDGGAGGFYEGMKQAYDANADWLWMMDDDGVPENNQLEELLKHAEKDNLLYTNALVTAIDDPTKLAFSLGKYNSVDEAKKEPVIHNLINPFNGTLISRKVIDKIGMIKREMFIWGDETEYTNRVKKNGFKMATITSAIHNHPFMRGTFEQAIPLLNQTNIVVKPNKFAHIYYRNLGYNQANYASKKASKVLYALYHIYFITRFKFKELHTFRNFFNDGLRNNFTRK
jgi:rhamnopyranosyl-N-acetylglucosaminyl-diphospho-decaprenol beta-1,3/1,4-galactofuranosyltransferase